MKNIIKILFIFQLLSLMHFAQSTSNTNEIEIFNKKSREVLALFKNEKFKDAKKVAEDVLTMSKRLFGENSPKTATSYSNIAEIHRMLKDYETAVKYFDLSLKVFESDLDNNYPRVLTLLKNKGIALTYGGKKTEAEEVFKSYVLLAEKKFGKESKLLLPVLKSQWNYYLYTKNYDKVEELFTVRMIASIKSKAINETETIEDEFMCYLHRRYKSKQISKKIKLMAEAVNKVAGQKSKFTVSGNSIVRGPDRVKTGKVKSLPTPNYPSKAQSRRIRGVVMVRIKIGKSGDILAAKAFCGPTILHKSAEDAAKLAKFNPTMLDGNAVEVSGVISYRFL